MYSIDVCHNILHVLQYYKDKDITCSVNTLACAFCKTFTLQKRMQTIRGHV